MIVRGTEIQESAPFPRACLQIVPEKKGLLSCSCNSIVQFNVFPPTVTVGRLLARNNLFCRWPGTLVHIAVPLLIQMLHLPVSGNIRSLCSRR